MSQKSSSKSLSPQWNQRLHHLRRWVLYIGVALLPFFVLTGLTVGHSKATFIMLWGGVLVGLGLLRLLGKQNFKARLSTLAVSGGFMLAIVLGAMYSGDVLGSLMGQLTYIDAGLLWVMIIVIGLAIGRTLRTPQEQQRVMQIFSFSLAIILFWHIVRFFGGGLSLGLLQGPFSSVLGSWSNIGLFGTVLIVLSFTLATTRHRSQVLLLTYHSFFFIGFVAMMISNLTLAWIALGLWSFFTILVSLRFRDMSNGRHRIYLAIILGVLAIVGMALSQPLDRMIVRRHTILHQELRPSASASWQVTRSVLGKEGLFGVGSNQFSEAWLRYRPTPVLGTQFATSDITTSFGRIPTLIATLGWVGILSLLMVLGLVIRRTYQMIQDPDGANWKVFHEHDLVGLLVIFWIISIIFPVGSVWLVWLAIITAWVLQRAELRAPARMVEYRLPSYLGRQIIAGFGLLVIVVFGYYIVTRLSIERTINRNLANLNQVEAFRLLRRAHNQLSTPATARALIDLHLGEAQAVIRGGAEIPAEQYESLVQTNLEQALALAQRDLDADRSFHDALTYGNIYAVMAEANIEDAARKADDFYARAELLSPGDLRLGLARAELRYAIGRPEAALAQVDEVLRVNPSVLEALMLGAQAAIDLEQFELADQYLQSALRSAPTNLLIIRTVGMMYARMGVLQSAQALLGTYIQFQPDDQQIQAVLDEIATIQAQQAESQ